jgi:hypothetical protein
MLCSKQSKRHLHNFLNKTNGQKLWKNRQWRIFYTEGVVYMMILQERNCRAVPDAAACSGGVWSSGRFVGRHLVPRRAARSVLCVRTGERAWRPGQKASRWQADLDALFFFIFLAARRVAVRCGSAGQGSRGDRWWADDDSPSPRG